VERGEKDQKKKGGGGCAHSLSFQKEGEGSKGEGKEEKPIITTFSPKRREGDQRVLDHFSTVKGRKSRKRRRGPFDLSFPEKLKKDGEEERHTPSLLPNLIKVKGYGRGEVYFLY